jgi:hypothetical protein
VATGTTGDSSQAAVLAYRYVDLTLFDPASLSTTVDNAFTATVSVNSITTLFDDTTAISITGRWRDAADTFTPSAAGGGAAFAWNERVDSGSANGAGSQLHVQDALIQAAGASGATTIAPSNTTSTRAIGVTLGIPAKRARPRQLTSIMQHQAAAI